MPLPSATITLATIAACPHSTELNEGPPVYKDENGYVTRVGRAAIRTTKNIMPHIMESELATCFEINQQAINKILKNSYSGNEDNLNEDKGLVKKSLFPRLVLLKHAIISIEEGNKKMQKATVEKNEDNLSKVSPGTRTRSQTRTPIKAAAGSSARGDPDYSGPRTPKRRMRTKNAAKTPSPPKKPRMESPEVHSELDILEKFFKAAGYCPLKLIEAMSQEGFGAEELLAVRDWEYENIKIFVLGSTPQELQNIGSKLELLAQTIFSAKKGAWDILDV